MPPKSIELACLGHIVRGLRAEVGLSQEALAHAADLHPNYVGGVERGERNPSFAALLKLARGLGRRPSEVLERLERSGEGGPPRGGS
jgi:transcriptional regulator with XRE-family HTH domain